MARGRSVRHAAIVVAVAMFCHSATVETATEHEVRGGEFARGLLWRVSKPGVSPSHVFGTIHVADPRVLDVPDPVIRALTRSRHYYTENVPGERGLRASTKRPSSRTGVGWSRL